MGALVAVRHDPEMGAFYHRLLSRGKRKKQALVAVAHKLLIRNPSEAFPQVKAHA
jgi:transposase